MLQDTSLSGKGDFALYLDRSGGQNHTQTTQLVFYGWSNELKGNEDSIKTLVAEFKSRWSMLTKYRYAK